MPKSPPPAVAQARARLGGFGKRRVPADRPDVQAAKRDLEVAKLADHAQRIADQLGDFTPAEREAITAPLARAVRSVNARCTGRTPDSGEAAA